MQGSNRDQPAALRAIAAHNEALLAATARQAQELNLLDQVRTALARELELPDLFRTVVEAIASVFGYTQVSIYRLEEETLVLQHQVGYDRVIERIPIMRGIAGRVARTGEPVLLEDVTTDPAFLGAMEGIASEVCVPFFDQGRVAGILNLETTGAVRLGEADLRLMVALSEHISIAVGRVRLHAQARASEERLRLALDAAQMGTWDWDVRTGQVYWSPAMGPLYGLPAGTPGVTAEEWFALIHPDDRERVRDADRRHITHESDYEVEFRVVWPDGTVRWLFGKGQAVERDERGRATHMVGVTMCITARKQAEAERLELVRVQAARAQAEAAERRITDTLERITEAFVALDPTWRFAYLNERAAQLLRRSRAELLGKTLWREFPEAVGTALDQRLRDAVAAQTAVEFDVFYDPLGRWLEVHAFPAPEGLSLFIQDVSERRQADEALRRSDARFRSLVQHSSDVISVVAEDGTRLFISPSAEHVLGYPPEELVGTHVWSLIHPDDMLRAQRFSLDIARHPGKTASIELRLQHRDGAWRWLEVIADNRLDDPSIRGIVVNTRDITERQQAEENAHFLAEASALLASSLDVKTTLTSLAHLAVPYLANWCVVDALDDQGEVEQVAVAHVDLAKEERLAEVRDRYALNRDAPHGPARTLRTGETQLVPEVDDAWLCGVARDDDHLALLRELAPRSVIVLPLVARGALLGAISFAATAPGRYDAADLALAEELARRASLAIDNARLYQEAQAAIRARDQFLSVAAHELRTPITTVKGFADLLSQMGTGDAVDLPRLNRYLGRITDASQRLALLTNDLLDVSRLRLGQLPLRLQPLDAAELVEAVTQRYNDQLDGVRVLAVDVPDCACGVQGDADRLDQVLTNLLDNAVKYTPDGGEIRVALRETDDGVLLTVRDRGIGLPPDALESIFEPFARADNAERIHLPGLGLGLYICRSIVERHGGRIWAESAGENQGTTLHLWLPAGE